MMNEKEKKDLATSKVVLLSLAAVGILIIVWLGWLHPSRPNTSTATINSFAACRAAGNPVQESYPETCVTKDGKRFTNPDQSIETITISEWGVQTHVMDVTDAYYSYNAVADTIIVSSKTLDAAAEKVDGCRSGLHGITYERIRPGDANDSTGMPWKAEELQAKGAKVGEYYFIEKSLIETLCKPDETNRDVQKAEAQKERLQTALRSLTAR